ncbi:hypothetical protein LPJ67_001971 [Coemansia sp. RSA 1938]|nr:hypothetical protein LPJ67_001971 [Coemansia sp. RSA 1938]
MAKMIYCGKKIELEVITQHRSTVLDFISSLGFAQRAFAKPMAAAAMGRRLIGTDSKGGSGFGANLGGSPPTAKDFAREMTGQITSRGNTMVGRSVPVVAGAVGRAYARLNRILADNGVRHELRLRRRYEKPKYKRQRLIRESHARRFKAEVRKKVHLIWKMKELGA